MKKHLLLLLLLFCGFQLSAQWQYLPGPDGGYVFNLETDGSILYALAPTGIYRSEDQGYHWHFLPGTRGASKMIERLTVENGVFYGISTYKKLLRSNDGGQSWQPVLQEPFPSPGPEEYLKNVFVKGDTVLVTSTSTVYRSVDRGETWISTGDLLNFNQSRIFSTGSDFFSGGNTHFYRSSDGALSWERIFEFTNDFAVVGAVGNKQYILYDNMEKLARSTDGFRTWKNIETDVFFPLFGPSHYPLKLVGRGDTLYCIGKTTGSGCSTLFCYSTDGGDTWHAGNDGDELPVTMDDVVLFDQHLVFLNTQMGISHSTDGCKTFTTEQSGLTSTDISGIATQGKTVFAAGNRTVYYSKNGGQDWKETAPNTITNPCEKFSQMFSTQKRLYLIKRFGVKFYSEDEGTSWKPLETVDFYPVGTTRNGIWAADFQSLTRILDDGTTSTIDLISLLEGQGINSVVTAADHVIVVAKDHYLILNENGQLIRQIPAAPCNEFFFMTAEQMHFDGRNIFFFCTNNTYVFSEGASEWQQIYPQDWTTGIPLYHSPMTDIATYKDVTFVALDGKGIYYTTDATGRFYPLDTPCPELHPRKISFKDNSMWVSSDDGGIYTWDLPLVQIDASEKPVFRYSPNPSDGHLHLESDVFFTDEIRLDILDMAGRLAISKVLRPGQTWDLDFPTLPIGLYVLRLQTPLGVSALKWSVVTKD